MASAIIATPSIFREYLFSGLLKKDDLVIYENKKDFKTNYETSYLEKEIEEILKKEFSCSKSKCIYKNIQNINDKELINLLIDKQNINRIVMSGANYLRYEQYKKVSDLVPTILNIHFGDPNKFRGLDSNLWSLFYEKFSHPAITLHHANTKLDTGKIICIKKSKLTYKQMNITDLLRFEINNAKYCMKLALEVKEKTINSHEVLNQGIYKGAMSSEEKKVAFSYLNQ